ncbi:hypothetical protein ACQUY5_16755 [Bacillus cereus]|uniref:hypothetical protein n=1 Tax=Bacillus cereus TaxID=1396 RepID=UPI003D17DFEC
MSVVIVDYWENSEEIFSIRITDMKRRAFAYFRTLEQFQNFQKETDFIIKDGLDGVNETGGLRQGFSTNKEVRTVCIKNQEDVPKTAKRLRGITSLYVVDMFLLVEDNVLTIFKPEPISIQDFNPKEVSHRDFLNDYGSIQFIKEGQ